MSAVRSSKMTNNLKSSTYISIRSGQYFYWPDDLVSWFLKLECLRLQNKQNTSLPHGGGTSRKIGWGCAALFLKPLPYFRPKSVNFSTQFQTWSKIWPVRPEAWPKRVTSCYGKYMVGVNIKREIVLSPNDEEVASSKNIPNSRLEYTNHTLFQTKTAKKP